MRDVARGAPGYSRGEALAPGRVAQGGLREQVQRLLMPSVQVIECWWKRETALRRWHQAVDAAMRTAAELRALRAAMEEQMEKDAAARTVQRAWHVRQERKQRMVASRWQQMVMQAVKARAAAEHLKACALLERALKRFYIGRRWVAVLDAAQTAAYEAKVKRQAKAERRRARRVAAKLAEMEALETRRKRACATPTPSRVCWSQAQAPLSAGTLQLELSVETSRRCGCVAAAVEIACCAREDQARPW